MGRYYYAAGPPKVNPLLLRKRLLFARIGQRLMGRTMSLGEYPPLLAITVARDERCSPVRDAGFSYANPTKNVLSANVLTCDHPETGESARRSRWITANSLTKRSQTTKAG